MRSLASIYEKPVEEIAEADEGGHAILRLRYPTVEREWRRIMRQKLEREKNLSGEKLATAVNEAWTAHIGELHSEALAEDAERDEAVQARRRADERRLTSQRRIDAFRGRAKIGFI